MSSPDHLEASCVSSHETAPPAEAPCDKSTVNGDNITSNNETKTTSANATCDNEHCSLLASLHVTHTAAAHGNAPPKRQVRRRLQQIARKRQRLDRSRAVGIFGVLGLAQMGDNKAVVRGCNAVGSEVARNLALSGLGGLGLHDTASVSEEDVRASGIFLREDLGQMRDEQLQYRIDELETECETEVLDAAVIDDPEALYQQGYNVVVWCEEGAVAKEIAQGSSQPIAAFAAKFKGHVLVCEARGACFAYGSYTRAFKFLQLNGDKSYTVSHRIDSARCIVSGADAETQASTNGGRPEQANSPADDTTSARNPASLDASASSSSTDPSAVINGDSLRQSCCPDTLRITLVKERHQPVSLLVIDRVELKNANGTVVAQGRITQRTDAHNFEVCVQGPATALEVQAMLQAQPKSLFIATAFPTVDVPQMSLHDRIRHQQETDSSSGTADLGFAGLLAYHEWSKERHCCDKATAAAESTSTSNAEAKPAECDAAAMRAAQQRAVERAIQRLSGEYGMCDLDADKVRRAMELAAIPLLAPTAGMVGALAALDVLKLCSGRYKPCLIAANCDLRLHRVLCTLQPHVLEQRLANFRMLLVGAGALGCELAKHLALMGASRVWVVDFDTIALSNLHRQFLFRSEDAGDATQKPPVPAKFKADVACARLEERYGCKFTPVVDRIGFYDYMKDKAENGHAAAAETATLPPLDSIDCILSAVDSLQTRIVLELLATAKSTSIVSQTEGQVGAPAAASCRRLMRLLDGGTDGLQSHTAVFLPEVSQSNIGKYMKAQAARGQGPPAICGVHTISSKADVVVFATGVFKWAFTAGRCDPPAEVRLMYKDDTEDGVDGKQTPLVKAMRLRQPGTAAAFVQRLAVDGTLALERLSKAKASDPDIPESERFKKEPRAVAADAPQVLALLKATENLLAQHEASSGEQEANFEFDKDNHFAVQWIRSFSKVLCMAYEVEEPQDYDVMHLVGQMQDAVLPTTALVAAAMCLGIYPLLLEEPEAVLLDSTAWQINCEDNYLYAGPVLPLSKSQRNQAQGQAVRAAVPPPMVLQCTPSQLASTLAHLQSDYVLQLKDAKDENFVSSTKTCMRWTMAEMTPDNIWSVAAERFPALAHSPVLVLSCFEDVDAKMPVHLILLSRETTPIHRG